MQTINYSPTQKQANTAFNYISVDRHVRNAHEFMFMYYEKREKTTVLFFKHKETRKYSNWTVKNWIFEVDGFFN